MRGQLAKLPDGQTAARGVFIKRHFSGLAKCDERTGHEAEALYGSASLDLRAVLHLFTF